MNLGIANQPSIIFLKHGPGPTIVFLHVSATVYGLSAFPLTLSSTVVHPPRTESMQFYARECTDDVIKFLLCNHQSLNLNSTNNYLQLVGGHLPPKFRRHGMQLTSYSYLYLFCSWLIRIVCKSRKFICSEN